MSDRAQIIFIQELDPEEAEGLGRAIEEKRRQYNCELVGDYAIGRDGSETLLSTQYVTRNPLPGVVHGDDGLPDPGATAQREKERKLARIEAGAEHGRRKGRETKRDKTAREDKELLAAVWAHREKHPTHGRPAIAAALLAEHGREIDHADPRGREKAIEALRKKIDRLEKSLDT